MDIGKEIKQKKFTNEFHKTHINILFTSSYIAQRLAATLKEFNISRQQFNILRIIKGQHPKPSTVKLLTDRMVDKMSNASRIVDKLETKGLVKRRKNNSDGRQVDIIITSKGLKVLDIASNHVLNDINDCFKKLTKKEAVMLNDLLDKVREG